MVFAAASHIGKGRLFFPNFIVRWSRLSKKIRNFHDHKIKTKSNKSDLLKEDTDFGTSLLVKVHLRKEKLSPKISPQAFKM